jgi:C-terminal region of band_7
VRRNYRPSVQFAISDFGFEMKDLSNFEIPQYIEQFGKMAKEANTLVLPANLSDVGSILTLAMNVIKEGKPNGFTAPTAGLTPG